MGKHEILDVIKKSIINVMINTKGNVKEYGYEVYCGHIN